MGEYVRHETSIEHWRWFKGDRVEVCISNTGPVKFRVIRDSHDSPDQAVCFGPWRKWYSEWNDISVQWRREACGSQLAQAEYEGETVRIRLNGEGFDFERIKRSVIEGIVMSCVESKLQGES